MRLRACFLDKGQDYDITLVQCAHFRPLKNGLPYRGISGNFFFDRDKRVIYFSDRNLTLRSVICSMTIVRPATRHGKKGHIVKVTTNKRFVPEHYPGKDPRTKARR